MKNNVLPNIAFFIYTIIILFLGFNFGRKYSDSIKIENKTEIEFKKRSTKFEYLKNDLDRISRSSDKSDKITNEHLAHVLYIMLHELEMQQKQIDKLDSLR